MHRDESCKLHNSYISTPHCLSSHRLEGRAADFGTRNRNGDVHIVPVHISFISAVSGHPRTNLQRGSRYVPAQSFAAPLVPLCCNARVLIYEPTCCVNVRRIKVVYNQTIGSRGLNWLIWGILNNKKNDRLQCSLLYNIVLFSKLCNEWLPIPNTQLPKIGKVPLFQYTYRMT